MSRRCELLPAGAYLSQRPEAKIRHVCTLTHLHACTTQDACAGNATFRAFRREGLDWALGNGVGRWGFSLSSRL